jgi:hypothetical protein
VAEPRDGTHTCSCPVGAAVANVHGYPDVDWDQQLKRCGELVQSRGEMAKNLAGAFNNRGVAYYFKGESDRAITLVAKKSSVWAAGLDTLLTAE